MFFETAASEPELGIVLSIPQGRWGIIPNPQMVGLGEDVGQLDKTRNPIGLLAKW